MRPGECVVAAAMAAVGTRFRPHGRDLATGVDCVGLALLALRAGGFVQPVPEGYALRGGDARRIAAEIEARGLVVAQGSAMPGDLLLCQAGPAQFHFAVQTTKGVIHADATLRRVVERPGTPPWPVIGRWRIADREE